MVVVVALWAKRDKVRGWLARRKPEPTPVSGQPTSVKPRIPTVTQAALDSYRAMLDRHTAAKKDAPPKEEKPYKRVEGYARHKGSHIRYRARVAKDDPSEFTITWVGPEPLCAVCKIPLVRKKQRDMNPRMVCPDCGKVHGPPFKASLDQHWVRFHIEEDLSEKGHIKRT